MHPIWIFPFTAEEINLRAQGTLSDHLGIEFTEVGPDSLTAIMRVDSRTCQPIGVLHGGASCALAETVASAAANYCVDQTKNLCVGLQINANHIRFAKEGSLLKAIAKPIHLGKSTQVWEIKIYNESEQVICLSSLTLAVISKQK